MNTLHIKGLRVSAQIGVHRWEQAIKQILFIDIILKLDLTNCQDAIENTLDYAKLAELVTQHIESKPFKLIETVALDVIQLIHKHFSEIEVTVSVNKPHAIKNAAGVEVVIQHK